MAVKKTNDANDSFINKSELIKKDWYKVIKGYALSNNLTKEEVCEIFSQETTKAINRDIDPEAEIIFELDNDEEKVIIFNNNMEVVEDNFEFESENDPERISFITISEASKLHPNCEVGDVVKYTIDFNLLSEKIKTVIRNGFIQRLKMNQKRKVFNKYSNLIGQRLKARVLSKNNNGSYNMIFEDNVTAFLPSNKVNRRLQMKPGSIIDVYLEEVHEESKLSQCLVSTDSPKAVEDLLKNDIPEISDGSVEIVRVVRQPGERSKIAVKSIHDENIDAAASIIGVNGSRILSISEKLEGEKLDVIPFSDDLRQFIINAMSPAKVVDVVFKTPDNDSAFVILNKENILVAIGKKGSNIELAKNLTGVNLEAITTEEALEKEIPFKESKEYDKPLIKKPKGRKPTKSNNFFSGFNFDINEFAQDVSEFMEQQTSTIEKNQSENSTKNEKPKVKKSEKLNLDDFFSEDNVLELEKQSKNSDEYDFLNDIDFDKIFDDNEISEFDEDFEDDTSSERPEKEKKSVDKEYKKAKIELRDFKVDSDLANYGLDSNLDLSDFDDEWEK